MSNLYLSAFALDFYSRFFLKVSPCVNLKNFRDINNFKQIQTCMAHVLRTNTLSIFELMHLDWF